MENTDYGRFREEFAESVERLRIIRNYGALLEIAEIFPQTVKAPYRFLSDGDIPTEEKYEALEAAYDIAGRRGEVLFEFVFDTSSAELDPETFAGWQKRQ